MLAKCLQPSRFSIAQSSLTTRHQRRECAPTLVRVALGPVRDRANADGARSVAPARRSGGASLVRLLSVERALSCLAIGTDVNQPLPATLGGHNVSLLLV